MSETDSNRRENNIAAIRLMAALMVIAGHMGILIGGAPPLFLHHSIQGLGVAIFFTIGGYFITSSWCNKPKVLDYTCKRFFRIVPPLAVCVIFTAFIAGPILSSLTVKEYFSSPTTYRYLKNIGLYIQYFLPGVFEANPYPNAINGSLWSLPVEVFMYIMIPIFVEITSLRNNKKTSKIAFAAICILICAARIFQGFFYPNFNYVVYATGVADALNLIPYYMIGALYTFPEVKKWCNLQLASLLLILYACFKPGFVAATIGIYIILPYFIFSLAFTAPPFFSNKLKITEFSYGIYLYSFFIQQTIVWLFKKLSITVGYNIYFIICTVVSLIFAYLSYKYIEKPTIAFSKKLLQKFEKAKP